MGLAGVTLAATESTGSAGVTDPARWAPGCRQSRTPMQAGLVPGSRIFCPTPSQVHLRLLLPGVYVGEALPPVPLRLAEKIRRWEMAEILPELWSVPGRQEEAEGRRAPVGRPHQVTDVSTWLRCFAMYTSVLSGPFPQDVPEILAYVITMTQVARDYEGISWVHYDADFRRQVAISRNRCWSQINPSLYSLCFTGRAQTTRRCELCFSATHTSRQCPLTSDSDPELPSQLRAVETAVASLVTRRQLDGRASGPARVVSQDACRLWNNNWCFFRSCRFRHVCNGCGAAHPVTACTRPSGTDNAPPLRCVWERHSGHYWVVDCSYVQVHMSCMGRVDGQCASFLCSPPPPLPSQVSVPMPIQMTRTCSGAVFRQCSGLHAEILQVRHYAVS